MDDFTFGMYKGKNVIEVIRENWRYVFWASNHVEFFKLTSEQQKELERIMAISGPSDRFFSKKRKNILDKYYNEDEP